MRVAVVTVTVYGTVPVQCTWSVAVLLGGVVVTPPVVRNIPQPR